MSYLFSILFYMIPLLFFAFFIVSLVMYVGTVKKNKRCPDSTLQSKINTWKVLLIVSSVLAGIMLAIVVAVIVLMYMVIAYM